MGTIRWSCSSVILLSIIYSCRAAVLESIYWNTSNTKFTAGRGLVLYPQIGDKMDIVCPRTSTSSGGKEEFYRVYLVTRSQMETCTVDKADNPLLNCDKPHRDVKFTFKFQEFSPNLWGLEFLKGKDYYITSTSTSSLQGLDNTNGGVCRTKSMKLVLRVGQSSSDPPSTLQESPTRFPPTRPKSTANNPSVTGKDTTSIMETDLKDERPGTDEHGGFEAGQSVWIISGCVILLVVIISVLALLRRYRRSGCESQGQQSTSVPLNISAAPKRDSTSSENNGSDRSDVVFPLRASDNMICHHYERVSGDYGAPVYIVQEITPQSPTNIFYKV